VVRTHGGELGHNCPAEEAEVAMVDAWTLVRFLHVLSAMMWVGGQLLLSLLVLPVLRRGLDAASRAPLTRQVGVRFGIFPWPSSCPCRSSPGSPWPPTGA
jgi:putative copper export protein